MKPLTLVILTSVFWAYIALGMICFYEIERVNEIKARDVAKKIIAEELDVHSCLNRSDLMALVLAIQELNEQGVEILEGNASSEVLNWDLHNAFFFSLTVITTIGYGNQTPATHDGKLFCVLYALVGIPLCMVVLAGMGERLAKANSWMCNRCFTSPRIQRRKAVVHMLALILMGVVLLVFVPAIIFTFYQEDWTFETSLYYAIITLSTIGFGDYVVSNESIVARSLSCIWIFLGLAWFSSLIGQLQQYVTSVVGKTEELSGEHIRKHVHTKHSENRRKVDEENNLAVTGGKRQSAGNQEEINAAFNNTSEPSADGPQQTSHSKL